MSRFPLIFFTAKKDNDRDERECGEMDEKKDPLTAARVPRMSFLLSVFLLLQTIGSSLFSSPFLLTTDIWPYYEEWTRIQLLCHQSPSFSSFFFLLSDCLLLPPSDMP